MDENNVMPTEAVEANEEDNATYRLTTWGCLHSVLEDYGIDISNITPKIGQHMVDDFFNLLYINGYAQPMTEATDENQH